MAGVVLLLPAPAVQAPSQDLLYTLLELGESFLSSDIREDDLQDLETKISAARDRDYDTIRDLQKKIDELSGMSAMVNRLKEELREEKERAKEDAEDLTQEMAELRYQLMERVDLERELRARTEEASVKRISELEEQIEQERKLRIRLEMSFRTQLDTQQQAEHEHKMRVHAEELLKKLAEVEEQVEREYKFRVDIEEASSKRISELEQEVIWLKLRLEEAEGELEAENEQHVEALIQYEEERSVMEADLEAAKRSLSLSQFDAGNTLSELAKLTLVNSGEAEKNAKDTRPVDEESSEPQSHKRCVAFEENELAMERRLRVQAEGKAQELACTLHRSEGKVAKISEEAKLMQDQINMLKHASFEKQQLISSLTEELFLQKEANRSLMKRTSSLDSDLQLVHEKLQICEAETNEMGSTILNLQEALLVESTKAMKGQAELALLAERVAKQEEEFSQLSLEFDALLVKFKTLEGSMEKCKKREAEAIAKENKLGLELTFAKEEVVKSEVRLQRIMRQKDEQLDMELARLEGARKQANWYLGKQTEHVKKLEAEKTKLMAELQEMVKNCEQLEKERDELKLLILK